MIRHPSFANDPWQIRETALDLDVLAQSESVFTLANGHLGLRGNLDEGEPAGLPGTYLNSVFEWRSLGYVEPGFAYPAAGQSVINVTNGKLIRLLVDDAPFDVRYGKVQAHERVLDLRTGILARRVTWESPTGQVIRVTTERLVSFTQRAVAAIRYVVEPVSGPMRLVVQSELVANEPLPPPVLSQDPRVSAPPEAPLHALSHGCSGLRVGLVHQTTTSALRVAAAMDHEIAGPPNTEATAESLPDIGRVTVTCLVEPGQTLCVMKLLGYGWSSHRSEQALADQAVAALTAARHTGWDGLLAEQRTFLDEFWERADVEVEGDDEVQQAVRFALFHILQAGARGEDRPIAAKGLTGPGYEGQAFWDTETFVLPVLTYMLPEAAASALRWRHATLPAARKRARLLGLAGAAFPWRTITGEESSGYWPASTAAVHVNADIADAVLRYVDATQDTAFEQEVATELLVETARLWRSLGHFDGQGQFRIDGVTGPDEYSALADNNVYTNLMAQQNLLGAADAAQRYPDRAEALGVTSAEIAAWRAAASAVLIPYDATLGVHAQSEKFTEHETWDFAATPPESYPLLLHAPYLQLYRKQVVKQPDLVLAMHLRGDAFTPEQKARNFAYYERLTVRDSSLAAGTQAVLAAEVGHLDLAYDYLGEAALMDLEDLEHNTRDGIHIATLAGAWLALVGGFGGMRAHTGLLAFAPRLPEGLTRLAFHLFYRDCRLSVSIRPESATYERMTGSTLQITHHGELLTLQPHTPITRPIPPAPVRERPTQPKGREPERRLHARAASEAPPAPAPAPASAPASAPR